MRHLILMGNGQGMVTYIMALIQDGNCLSQPRPLPDGSCFRQHEPSWVDETPSSLLRIALIGTFIYPNQLTIRL
jgi:hypothetical protein